MKSEPMPPNNLATLFDGTSGMPHKSVKEQLSYNKMMWLAENFIDWAMADNVTPGDIVEMIGGAKGMRRLAESVGDTWQPPEPEKISLIGFLGREAERRYSE